MHDKNGTPVKVGDTVTIECVITQCSPGEFCALDVETVIPMPGNGQKNKLYALNAAQVLLISKAAAVILLIACMLFGSTQESHAGLFSKIRERRESGQAVVKSTPRFRTDCSGGVCRRVQVK